MGIDLKTECGFGRSAFTINRSFVCWTGTLPMFSDEDRAALVVTLAQYNYWLTYTLAQHGSPNDVDAHVPILFYGSRIKAGRFPEFARVVDMAPTLAAIVHVTPQERLDGHILQDAIR